MPVTDTPQHPGQYVREQVLRPRKLTVKEAAELIGVGRPALSNFLNGKSSLSEEMAAKLSRAFNLDKKELLELQRNYRDLLNKDEEKEIPIKGYVPPYLGITATNIAEWADKIEARSLLPAFIRILVNTTGAEITASDFPAFDDAQRPGWDGYCESNSATPWIPTGVAGWEFGCNKNIKSKADSDYRSRTESDGISDEERKDITFIFITPRRWSQKEKWVQSAKAEGKWKDVRVFDALDLEQWLQTSIPAQIWLGGQFGVPTEGVCSLSSYWKSWSEVAQPPISPKIFSSAFEDHRGELSRWYESKPDSPFIISATSKEEAMAFISAINLQDNEMLEGLSGFSDRAIFLSTAESAKRLSEFSKEIIPIATTDKVQEELVISFQNRHSIIVIDRGSYGIEPNITIDLPSSESFRNALEDMGIDREEIDVHSNKSGNSPTIFRRLMSNIPAVSKPDWSDSPDKIRKLVPLILAGAWNSNQSADQQILELLGDKSFKNIEKEAAELAKLSDAPVWREGNYRGVVSKIDCLYAVSELITKDDLENFFLAALYVLSEEDPALELPEEDRWAANIYDKVCDHSDAIRASISENLIILAVHGDGLFGNSLGFRIADRVSITVRSLLRDIKPKMWMSQQNELPSYAEAAPEEFLTIVEDELEKEFPAFAPLFEPVGTGAFSRCNRSGMLWALEKLAWNPTNLSRVVTILGKLSTYELEDNWSNKPINSLIDILLFWKPQTAANVKQRCDVLTLLCKKYPNVGWEICIGPLKPGSGFTSGTSRPLWRNDASGAGHVLTGSERTVFALKCRELVLSWSAYDKEKLKELVLCLHSIGEENHERVYQAFKGWLDANPDNDDVLNLREYVRTHTLTSRARKRNKENEVQYANGKRLFALLEPRDVMSQHFWLFEKSWIELTPEELDGDDFDFEAKDKEIARQRIQALREIISEYGWDGLIGLIIKGGTGSEIGSFLQSHIFDQSDIATFILDCLKNRTEFSPKLDGCISGIFFSMDEKVRKKVIREVLNNLTPHKKHTNQIVRLFMSAPFKQMIWDQLAGMGKSIRAEYWSGVYPNGHSLPSDEMNFSVKKLIKAGRPKAAFHLGHLRPNRMTSETLIQLLEELALVDADKKEEGYRPQQYEIEKAFETLNERKDIDRTKLARLEYLYAEVLNEFSKYGLPNLSREIAGSPPQYMQLNVITFKRSDEGVDPTEWDAGLDAESKPIAARNAYTVLQNINVIPGTSEDGLIERDVLRKWITDVRSLAQELSRSDITDQQIGHLLSQARKPGKDGVWPREEIRDVFEEFESRHILTGMEIGIRNARGAMASIRSEKSTKERNLAEEYRAMAKKMENRRPFTSLLLNKIAQGYDSDAEWWEEDHRVNKRLRGW